jgi:hypothetical protein
MPASQQTTARSQVQQHGSARVPVIEQDAIVGHRLPNGYMSVHFAGQQCAYCDAPPADAPRAGN